MEPPFIPFSNSTTVVLFTSILIIRKGEKNTVARKRPTPYSTDRNKPYTLENVNRTAEPQNTQQEFNGKLL